MKGGRRKKKSCRKNAVHSKVIRQTGPKLERIGGISTISIGGSILNNGGFSKGGPIQALGLVTHARKGVRVGERRLTCRNYLEDDNGQRSIAGWDLSNTGG